MLNNLNNSVECWITLIKLRLVFLFTDLLNILEHVCWSFYSCVLFMGMGKRWHKVISVTKSKVIQLQLKIKKQTSIETKNKLEFQSAIWFDYVHYNISIPCFCFFQFNNTLHIVKKIVRQRFKYFWWMCCCMCTFFSPGRKMFAPNALANF